MKVRIKNILFTVFCIMLLTASTSPYPIDGYGTTGIRRLKRVELVEAGEMEGKKRPKGGLKSICDINLNLTGAKGDSLATLPPVDPKFQSQINSLFPNLDESYSLAILDITPGRKIRYATRKERGLYQPGSVGKLAVATGFFTELAKIYPYSFEQRQDLLCGKSVRAGKWAMKDEHTVPFFDIEKKSLVKRTVIESDVFSLYEWVDHMFSVSNNGAASVCWREAVLMRVFGKKYPFLTEEQANEYFKNTPKSELSTIANDIVNGPLRKLGITEEEWKLGSFFTKGAGSFIPPKGGSIGSPVGFMKFLVQLEQGKVIDQESSLEIKRMMYMTDSRVRYAQSPALANAALYFKSGSLYKCKKEEGYTCVKFKGNVENFMNSLAIVEHPDGTTYIVVLMSNVLKIDSAKEHAALASSIDKICRKLR